MPPSVFCCEGAAVGQSALINYMFRSKQHGLAVLVPGMEHAVHHTNSNEMGQSATYTLGHGGQHIENMVRAHHFTGEREKNKTSAV